MKKVISILLDKLAVQAGEVAISKAALAKENEESVQYYKWWQDEVAITKQLKKDVADLQAKLEVAEFQDSVAGQDPE